MNKIKWAWTMIKLAARTMRDPEWAVLNLEAELHKAAIKYDVHYHQFDGDF